tara:strand:- start:2257 stop:2664 length:408 start_codon:yes stop_codon:yes gene_type:complete
MSQPPINNNVKAFKDIKGKPGVSKPVNYVDFGATLPTPGITAQPKGLFKTKDDIQSPLQRMGILPSFMIQLPCVEVNDTPFKRVNFGTATAFNKSNVKAKPITGLSVIAFNREDRVGKFGMDTRQDPFAFSSFGA